MVPLVRFCGGTPLERSATAHILSLRKSPQYGANSVPSVPSVPSGNIAVIYQLVMKGRCNRGTVSRRDAKWRWRDAGDARGTLPFSLSVPPLRCCCTKKKSRPMRGRDARDARFSLLQEKKRFFSLHGQPHQWKHGPALARDRWASGQKKTARPELGGVVRGDGLEGAKRPLRRRRTYREP